MNRRSKALAVTACAGAVLCVSIANAEESNVTVVKAGDALSQMKVVRDKETGKLRPATSDEIVAMSQGSARSYGPSVVVLSRPNTTMVTRPDGSATIRRSIDDLDSVVVSRAADGKLHMQHGAKGEASPAQTANPKE